MWDAPIVRLTLRDTITLLVFAPVFAFFAGCFGLAIHDVLAADYVSIAGGKFGWTSFWLYILIAVAFVLGIIYSIGAIVTAMEYWYDHPHPIVAAFAGAICLPFAAFAIVGLTPEYGVNVDTIVWIIGFGLPLVGLAVVWSEMKYAHTRPYG